jgi:uncharacterized protein YdbL (DUF1318 family)
MKKYPVLYAVIAIWGLLFFTHDGNCFAGADDIKARMQERLPTIVQMKSDGLIGEDNKGYLEFVPGAAKKNETVIAAENNDRKSVYSAIAQQQKTTPELVGERRAIQIAEKGSPGEWFQDASGKWYKK